MSIDASTIQLGRYQLLERIGAGGTAHVHRGVAADGRQVAIKLLAPAAELDEAGARARFEREIHVLAELGSDNVVELLDHGIDAELGPYLVTPLLPGASLRAVVGEVELCPEAVLLLLEPTAAALAAVHEVGLVHRDLKPENLMASPDGQVVLVDLGLAFRQGQSRYTDEGAVVGSVPYMAPEQIEAREVTTAADIFAAGVMAYEWASGRRPFARERPAEEAAAILVGAHAPLAAADRRVSPQLSDLIEACLELDPAARPSAAQLLERVGMLIDWTDRGSTGAERAALIANPRGFQERVASFRVSRLARQAEADIARGECFAALKAIDRGLAYRPGDPGLRALSERAEAGAGAQAPIAAAQPTIAPGAGRSSRRRRFAVGAIIATLVIGGVAAISIWQSGKDDTPRLAPALRDPEADQAIQLIGGMMTVMERGVAAQEEEHGIAPGEKLRLPSSNASDSELALGLAGSMLGLFGRAMDIEEAERANPRAATVPDDHPADAGSAPASR